MNTQNDEILNIFEELQYSSDQETVDEWTEQCRRTGNFVLDAVFKLSNKVLNDTERRALEKGLGFAPI